METSLRHSQQELRKFSSLNGVFEKFNAKDEFGVPTWVVGEGEDLKESRVFSLEVNESCIVLFRCHFK